MALNLEVVADAIARSGCKTSKKFAKPEFDAALKYIGGNSDPDDLLDNVGRIANISAVRQELEKGGILPTAQSDSALIRAVKAALATTTTT